MLGNVFALHLDLPAVRQVSRRPDLQLVSPRRDVANESGQRPGGGAVQQRLGGDFGDQGDIEVARPANQAPCEDLRVEPRRELPGHLETHTPVLVTGGGQRRLVRAGEHQAAVFAYGQVEAVPDADLRHLGRQPERDRARGILRQEQQAGQDGQGCREFRGPARPAAGAGRGVARTEAAPRQRGGQGRPLPVPVGMRLDLVIAKFLPRLIAHQIGSLQRMSKRVGRSGNTQKSRRTSR